MIITIHELGHFCAARAFGVNILEFSIGMGPKLASLKRKKPPKPGKIRTLYTIRLLPIGGYVQMEGEETPPGRGKLLLPKASLAAADYLAAGIFMNLVLGFVILFGLYGFQDYIPTTTVAKFAERGYQFPNRFAGRGYHPFHRRFTGVYRNGCGHAADVRHQRQGGYYRLPQRPRVELTGVQFPMVTNEDGSSSIALDFYLYSRPNHFSMQWNTPPKNSAP